MKRRVATLVSWFVIAFTPIATAGDKQEGHVPRDSLYHLKLPNGYLLAMNTSLGSLEERQKSGVEIMIYKMNKGSRYIYWSEEWFTTLDYAPGTRGYYALVKVMKDRFFIFATWNSHYRVVNMRTGEIIDRGDTDDAMKEYDSLVPLKLTINDPIKLNALIGPASTKRQKQSLASSRRGSVFLRRETVAASKPTRLFIIKFEEPESKRKPLFVIAWKAMSQGSYSLNYPRPSDIVVHDHLLKPPSMKKAVYSLQPDYSLQKLDLTNAEISELFSHITRSEVRNDERVASLIKMDNFDLLDQQDPEWRTKLSIEQDVFPANKYWEEKVSPHLKVVEPPQSDRSHKSAIPKTKR